LTKTKRDILPGAPRDKQKVTGVIMHDLDKIIDNLPKLWKSYISAKANPKSHPFRKAISDISRTVKITGDDWWNEAINWLDDNHHTWRGYPAPTVLEVR
jgi:hypothetical protein